MFEAAIQSDLRARRAAGLHRQRHLVIQQQGAMVQIDGKAYVNFSGGDTLGLSQHPRVKQAATDAIERWGVGSGASQLVTGYREPHAKLETHMAKWLGFESALYVPNGYVANGAVCAALLDAQHTAFIARESHASLIDGLRATGAKLQRYSSTPLTALGQRLTRSDGQSVILSDTVFSMSGTLGPLRGLADLARRHQAALVLDDAHGVGVLGKGGRGALDHAGLCASDVTAWVCPLGKAVGGYGAVVLGKTWLIESMLQKARQVIYSTAPAPALAASALAAIQVMQAEPWHQQRLHANKQLFEVQLKAAGASLAKHDAAIYFLPLPNAHSALAAQVAARRAGLWCAAMRPPTVQQSGLRVVLSALHTEDQITALANFWVAQSQAMSAESAEAS